MLLSSSHLLCLFLSWSILVAALVTGYLLFIIYSVVATLASLLRVLLLFICSSGSSVVILTLEALIEKNNRAGRWWRQFYITS